MKQSKLRKRRVVRYAIMYFMMFFLFFILVVGPVIVVKFMAVPQLDIMTLQQPTNWNNNDTTAKETGNGLPGDADSTGADATASASASAFAFKHMARFVYES